MYIRFQKPKVYWKEEKTFIRTVLKKDQPKPTLSNVSLSVATD